MLNIKSAPETQQSATPWHLAKRGQVQELLSPAPPKQVCGVYCTRKAPVYNSSSECDSHPQQQKAWVYYCISIRASASQQGKSLCQKRKHQGSAVDCAEKKESTSYSLQTGGREQAPVCQGSSEKDRKVISLLHTTQHRPL